MRATATTYDAVTRDILAERRFLERLALRLSRRAADADDLVQETVLRAYRARDRFRPGTSMRAWLATILRRLFLTDAIKTRRRGTQTDTDTGDSLAYAVGGARSGTSELSYEQTLERVDERLKLALERVPEIYREPFVLFSLDGLAYAEIATQLAIPVGTVMSRIHRARQRLKGALAASGYRAA